MFKCITLQLIIYICMHVALRVAVQSRSSQTQVRCMIKCMNQVMSSYLFLVVCFSVVSLTLYPQTSIPWTASACENSCAFRDLSLTHTGNIMSS